MVRNIILKIVAVFLLGFTLTFAQSEGDVDAIEKARQAKEAADKAAAEAAAATEAAIEAAATKAAKEAREEAKQKKEEEAARKIAEAAAAEEAELDAAAQAAAEEAKRKMAAELGLEIEDEETVEETVDAGALDSANVEDVIAKKGLGFNIGAAASVGLLSGATFTSVPVGATVVLATPFGFKLGPLDYNISLAFGGYSGKYDTAADDEYTGEAQWIDEFNPTLFGVGGNLTVAEFIFAEGHVGYVGQGPGFRGFAGITLERLMNKGLNLPVNLLIGSEGFISTDMAGAGNTSGWASLGVRLDYSF